MESDRPHHVAIRYSQLVWRLTSFSITPMTSITCLIATLLALITLPLLILWRLSLTKQQTAKRYRAQGNTYKVIANKLGVSQTTARRYATV